MNIFQYEIVKKYLLWVMVGNLVSIFFVDMLGVIMQERNEGCTYVNLMMMWFYVTHSPFSRG